VFGKRSLKDVDEYTVAWSVSLFSTPFFLAMLLFVPIPQIGPGFWYALIGTGILNLIAVILYMKALKASDLSITIPMLTFTPIFLLVTGPLMLGEFPSFLGIIGIFLIVAGSYILNIKKCREGLAEPFKALLKETGPRLMLVVAFIYSITSNFDKIGVTNSSPVFFAIAANLFAAVALSFIVAMKAKGGIGSIKKSYKMIAPIGIFHALGTIAQMTAYTFTIVAYVISIKRTGILVSILFGYFLFKEKNIKERLIGAAIMVAGVILIAFS